MMDTINTFIDEEENNDYFIAKVSYDEFVNVYSKSEKSFIDKHMAGILKICIKNTKAKHNQNLKEKILNLFDNEITFLIRKPVIITINSSTCIELIPVIFAHNTDDEIYGCYNMDMNELQNKSSIYITSALITLSKKESMASYKIIGIKQILSHYIDCSDYRKFLNKINICLTRHSKAIDTCITNKMRKKTEFSTSAPIRIESIHKLKKYYNELTEDGTNKDTKIYIEKKLDGVRCIAYCTYIPNAVNKVILKTRNNIPITSQHHIEEEIIKLTREIKTNIILDGELMCDDMPAYEIAAACNSQVTDIKLRYEIFDVFLEMMPKMIYSERINFLDNMILSSMNGVVKLNHIKQTQSMCVFSWNDIIDFINECKRDDEEGVIIRNGNAPYTKKSAEDPFPIYKYKFFTEDKFICCGITHDNDENIIYIFKTYDTHGNEVEFNCQLSASLDVKKQLYHDFIKKIYCPIGAQFSIRYKAINKFGIPEHATVIS
ncbi:MAG: hypothetical protein KDH96_08720, partial [Candidatus Riesia sp.]|nr:hypothetical protein [Candidatus Riesia sp.]